MKSVSRIVHDILQKDKEIKGKMPARRSMITGRLLNPGEIIPMDNEDFKEF